MIKAYEFFCTALTHPVIVFAHSLGNASEHFSAWHQRHVPVLRLAEATIVEWSYKAARAEYPQLADAMRAGAVGVCYWLGHRKGWMVAPADADPIGRIAPPEPLVKCFEIQSYAVDKAFVFAVNEERSAIVFAQYIHGMERWLDEWWDAVEHSRWLLIGPKLTLREQMDDGIEGVGIERDGSWHFIPVSARG